MIIGNTVKIIGTFVDWNGNKINAIDPVLKVYTNKNELVDTLTVNNTSTGVYEADYIVPALDDEWGDLIFEMSGIVEGMPEVARTKRDRSML